MINNSTLVHMYLLHLFANRPEKLAALTGENFSYASPATKPINLSELTSHCDKLFKGVFAKINHIRSVNDKSYYVDFQINLRGDKPQQIFSISSRARISVHNNLVENILISYDPRNVYNGIAPPKQLAFC